MAAISTARAEQTKKEFLKTLAFWFGVSYVTSALVYWIGTLYEIAVWGGILVTLALVCAIVVTAIFIIRANKKAQDGAVLE